ncbi:MAG: hypothetical protein ABIA02_02380, partial [Candidatus Falkowbacteria bacterium]
YHAKLHIGLTEKDVEEKTGLGNNALGGLYELETKGFIRSFISKEGTAGPFARRYKINDNIEINVSVQMDQTPSTS